MPIFGPRLDRPSAIGDEGRPRAASLGVATVAFLAVVVPVAVVTNLTDQLSLVGLGGPLVVVGSALIDRESTGALAIGHLCLLPGGITLVAAIAVGLLAGGPAAGLLLFGMALGVVGLGGAWANVQGKTVIGATKQGWGGAIAPLVFLFVATIVAAVGLFVWRFEVAPGTEPSLAGLLLLVGLVALAGWAALSWLPVGQLVTRDRRQAVIARRDRWRRRLRLTVALGTSGWLVVGVLEFAGLTTAVYRHPVVAVVLRVLSTPWVRLPLALAGLAVGVAALCGWIARWLTRDRDSGAPRPLGPVFGGLVLLAIPTPLVAMLLGRMRQGAGPGGWLLLVGAVLLIVVAAVLFLVVFSLGPVAIELGVLPDRAGSLSLASAGTLLVAIGAGLLGVRSWLLFATVAAAMLVWDVSEFGLGLTLELGHRPETRRLELFHGLVATGVAVAAVAVVTGLSVLARSVGPANPPSTALLLAVSGVLVLLAPLRG